MSIVFYDYFSLVNIFVTFPFFLFNKSRCRFTRFSSKEVKASEKGDAVVKYAKNFVGNRYRYGGSSLTKGTDCSGFTRGVYKKFGKRLPHSSSAQRRYGKKVKGGIKNAQAGDLICYSGHVAIYMGNNKIVHASNSAPYPRGGIKISNNARYRRIVTVRRIVK